MAYSHLFENGSSSVCTWYMIRLMFGLEYDCACRLLGLDELIVSPVVPALIR